MEVIGNIDSPLLVLMIYVINGSNLFILSANETEKRLIKMRTKRRLVATAVK